MTEETPFPETPINEYARTKLLGEAAVKAYQGPWCILRPRAVFGPGDTVVFPRVLRAARAGTLPWIEADEMVMGDLIYIDSLVAYIIRAIERCATGSYNLTNDHPVPLLAFLGDVLGRLGLPPPTRRMRAKTMMRVATAIEAAYRVLPFLGEPPVTRFGVSVFSYSKTFDVSKALRDLGQPSVPFSEAVSQFVEWQKGRP
jgi:nucleoside-diphosphate-sugar epimerase